MMSDSADEEIQVSCLTPPLLLFGELFTHRRDQYIFILKTLCFFTVKITYQIIAIKLSERY